MMKQVKQEPNHHLENPPTTTAVAFVDLSDSDSDCDSEGYDDVIGSGSKRPREEASRRSEERLMKKKRAEAVLPVGFLAPLPTTLPEQVEPLALAAVPTAELAVGGGGESCKQFWKAGDYDGPLAPSSYWDSSSGGMDHVRVHPRFLHSNATSHKWVLGAFAELLDNALDEVASGATFVNIDMAKSKKDGSKMLLIEDDGGGMNPDKMRQCMSLGYSMKSKMADTIGQYGNGFKTSTMRLGADVIVFSRCRGKDGMRPTQSIGLLSYTFLRNTGKEDIVVPMLDYEKREQDWNKIIRLSASDWNRNVETIVQWSPFSSEADLLRQFNQMKDQGTRVIIYNLWEDDLGQLELDFDTDPHDIQIRGVNRDEKNIEMANKYPNSRHFLTYRHSLRSYVAILYLRVPPGFRIILRGKDVEHHNIVNDMMMSKEITYRPQAGSDGVPANSNMVAVVTIGFVKDAKAHIDVQGFNVYHKNRLIKPFWRLWHAAGSDGRGVIGVLEANFVEPAHDKQGFERTTVLARLETRLIQMQKTYWTSNCHKIGYAPRGGKRTAERGPFTDSFSPSPQPKKTPSVSSSKAQPTSGGKAQNNGNLNGKGDMNLRSSTKRPSFSEQSSSSVEEDVSDMHNSPRKWSNASSLNGKNGTPTSNLRSNKNVQNGFSAERPIRTSRNSYSQKEAGSDGNELSQPSAVSQALKKLKEENDELKERLRKREEEILGDLLDDLRNEKEKCKLLQDQLDEANRKLEEQSKEQDSLIDIFAEERQRRDVEEENLRKKLKDASKTIQDLLDKVKVLEKGSKNRK